jgi:hypothetical protein
VKRIELPGGLSAFHPGTDAEAEAAEDLIARRHKFVQEFCASKGWPTDPTELSIEQILEIREQPGWQDPSSQS